MKVVVAGSRYGVYQEFFDSKMRELFLDEECSQFFIDEIVSGCADGVDQQAIDWAFKHNIKVTRFPAKWDEYGPSAGPIRNGQMAEYGDILIAFFNENAANRGTKNMCKQMVQAGKKVIRFHEKLCMARSHMLPLTKV